MEDDVKHERCAALQAEPGQAERARWPGPGALAWLILIQVFFCVCVLGFLRDLGTMMVDGRICYKRSGCRSWESDPWGMVSTAASHVVLLIFCAGIAWGGFAVLYRWATRC